MTNQSNPITEHKKIEEKPKSVVASAEAPVLKEKTILTASEKPASLAEKTIPAIAVAAKPRTPSASLFAQIKQFFTKEVEKIKARDAVSIGIFDRLALQEKIDFARHLAMVVKAGLPVYEGLKIINAQTESKTLKKVVDQVIIDINNGRFLADSLERFERVFGGFFINIIRVGEASGTLPQNLLYLAEELAKSKSLESKVKSAMVYPLVILVATLGVTGFLTFFVFPKLLPVLQGLNVPLPPTTLALIGTVNFLRSYGVYVAIGIVALVIAIKITLRKSEMIRYWMHRMIFFLPAVAPLSICINMANFARVFSLLLKSGVKIIEALTITANTFTNLVYQRSLLDAREEIQKGGQLATFLSEKKQFFPPLLSGMVQVGESTGNLEENLAYLADYYEEEVDSKLHGLTSLLEPIMLLIMGLMVGFVAISIITPIYSISSGVK